MLSNNKKLRKDFDNLWEQKLENSRYNLEESFESWSSRRIKLGDKLVFYRNIKTKSKLVFGGPKKQTEQNERVRLIGKVVKKPTYMDEFFKSRPGNGYIVLQEENGDIFYASIQNVFAKII